MQGRDYVFYTVIRDPVRTLFLEDSVLVISERVLIELEVCLRDRAVLVVIVDEIPFYIVRAVSKVDNVFVVLKQLEQSAA